MMPLLWPLWDNFKRKIREAIEIKIHSNNLKLDTGIKMYDCWFHINYLNIKVIRN